MSVDPLAEKMPQWNPYTYTFNNPINFTNPTGMVPYPITIRSFAPFKTFGGGFHGDDRGYSTGDVSARVHQEIKFDTDKSQMSAKAWSSSTSHKYIPGSDKAKSTVEFTDEFKIKTHGDSKTFMFGTHSKGANPMVPGSPNIDVFSDFTITENKNAGTLDISGTLTGDNFPSTEAFMSDSSGQSLFLGIGHIDGGVGKNTGPMTELSGENRDRPIGSFNFSVTTDKKGNFTGVRKGDKTYSVEAWNKTFTTQSPQK